jgi:hypothetical protein
MEMERASQHADSTDSHDHIDVAVALIHHYHHYHQCMLVCACHVDNR